MKDFYRLLEEYLEYDGYEIVESEKGKTVVDTGEERLALIIAGPVVHEDDLLKLEEFSEKSVLITTEELPAETRESLPEDTLVWDRDVLIEKLGEMVLEKSTLEGIEEGEEGIKGPEREFEFDIEHETKEGVLEPIIDFEEVSELGEKLVGGFKYRLEVVPHYVFEYKIKDAESGKVYLNAVSGELNFWEKPFQIISELKRSHVKLEPNIPEEKSDEKTLKSLKEKYTEKKEKRWEENGATIVEKSQEGPSEEDIELENKGMVYVPMWAVEGTDGIVVINAARGKVEREL
ncbi:MAG: hypothetical protein KGY66_07640 [Candidatus Thermoplasmatota archaeon]|nr:hypothetical protein [Candidatus Thermoplasmatota archaeon]MBS3790770.1 hypothetical protein [Candidatus Thermoplasmatota archaeon]